MRKLLGNRDGNVGVAFALALPVLLGVTGLAVDSASFHNQRVQMQSVADSTALAVAKELHLYRKNLGELKAAGEARAASMLAEAGLAQNPHSIGVSVDDEQNLIDIELAAVAYRIPAARDLGRKSDHRVLAGRCIRAGQALRARLAHHGFQTRSRRTARPCSPRRNAPFSRLRIRAGSNVADDSRIVSTLICSSGGASGGGSSYEPAPETDCPALPDPLASRPLPALSGCTFTDLVIDASQELPGNAVFCGGLRIENGATVTLSPGIYVISGGKLEVKDTSKLIGDYVSFYFQDDAAIFTFEKDTTIDLGAPKDGELAGMLFIENPLSTDGRIFTIRSEHAQRLLGTIYLPGGKLEIDSNANVADQSAYTVIVANQIQVRGANLVVNSDYGGTDVPVPDGIGPNSTMVGLMK